MKTFKKYATIVALVALGVVVTAIAPEILGELLAEAGKAVIVIAATTIAKKIMSSEKERNLENKAMYGYALERAA